MEYVVGPSWDRRIIYINVKTENIGIAMTGGIDSWVLYNLLPPNVKIFNLKRDDGFDTKQISKLTGRDDVIHVPVEPGDPLWIKRGLVDLSENHGVDQLFTGANLVPHFKYFPEFDTQDCPARPWSINHPIIVSPFLHLYKYHIIDLANRLNIDLSQTQSCLTMIEGHCNNCWQCNERNWGFTQLGE